MNADALARENALLRAALTAARRYHHDLDRCLCVGCTQTRALLDAPAGTAINPPPATPARSIP